MISLESCYPYSYHVSGQETNTGRSIKKEKAWLQLA